MIHFVIGPACSGKSYFIRKTFPNAVVVDIFDFQENCYTVEDVAQSSVAIIALFGKRW